MAEHLLTTTEVAHRLNVSPRTVKRLLASGELPSLTIGAARRVVASDVDAYLAHRASSRGVAR